MTNPPVAFARFLFIVWPAVVGAAAESTSIPADQRAETTPGISVGDGLRLEISTEISSYFWGEPVNIVVRFSNDSDDATICLPVEEGYLSMVHGIESKLNIQLLALDDSEGNEWQRAPNGISQGTLCLAPGTESQFLLPNQLIPVGTYKCRIEYENHEKSPIGSDTQLWTGTIQSNEIEIQISREIELDSDEQSTITSVVQAHLALLDHHDDHVRYQAMWRLARLSEFSLSSVVSALESRNATVRLSAISCLSRIADASRAADLDFPRNTSFLPDLLRRYEVEQSSGVKKNIILALASFSDLGETETKPITDLLLRAIEDTDSGIQMTACILLCRFDEEKALDIVGDMLSDPDVFTPDAWLYVCREYSKLTGEECLMSNYPGEIKSGTQQDRPRGRPWSIASVGAVVTVLNAALWIAGIRLWRKRNSPPQQI